MVKVMHGDFVLAQPNGTDRRGRKEVRIVRVLEARKKQIVGVFSLKAVSVLLCLMTAALTKIFSFRMNTVWGREWGKLWWWNYRKEKRVLAARWESLLKF